MNVPGPKHPVNGCAVLHYAYSSPELRGQKARMYEELAPHLTGAERFHARTILTPNPVTKPLPFEPQWRLRLADIDIRAEMSDLTKDLLDSGWEGEGG
jgi:hypothetical protein